MSEQQSEYMSEQQSEPQVVTDAKEKLSETKEEEVILEAKEKLSKAIPNVIPHPSKITPVSSAQALKERLQWGEPGLTIIDARSREAFLEERITGAMLGSDVKSLPENREIYVYGNTDEETAEAVNNLRQDGFQSVSQLQGGLAGWKAVNGATEGRAT